MGIIDVSTLGKLQLTGPGAARLLERIYANQWRRLRVGRVRYGVMCNDEGVVLDDGVCARTGEQEWYLSTTSSGAGAVFEWMQWWMQSGWGDGVHLTDLTDSFAAFNLAGPRARATLKKLTGRNLSNAAFPYMRVRPARVAGVRCRLLRIGFTGELSYEIHCPAAYGVHVWETLMEAGAEFGILPFGVEAQRILRLEKTHIIVGQDTDALSDPFAANMEWAVKLDKEDFLGEAQSAAHLQPRPKAVAGGLQNRPPRLRSRRGPANSGGAGQGQARNRRLDHLQPFQSHPPGTHRPVLAAAGCRRPQPSFLLHLRRRQAGERPGLPRPILRPRGRKAANVNTFAAPTKLTPLYAIARGLEAEFVEDRYWRVAAVYTTVESEVTKAREGVALADETPRGKIRIEGAQAEEVLEAAFATGPLALGSGTQLAAGHLYRLRPDLFYLGTEPGAEEEALRQVAAAAEAAGLLVSVTDITHGCAEIRVVGAASPELMSKVCGLDFDPSVFPSGNARQTSVAKTAQLVIRRDLGPLPAYSLVGARSLGAYLWITLTEAGSQWGLAPLGRKAVEAVEKAGA